MLLLIPLDKFLRRIPAEAGMAISFALFIVFRNINRGSLGFEGWNFLTLPRSLYQNLLTAYLGMPGMSFYSTDYFSLIPWFFLFVTGYFLYSVSEKYNWLSGKFLQKKIPVVDYLGKHSLWVYLLHQPIIYLVQELLQGIGII